MKILLIAGFSDSEIRDHLLFKKEHRLFRQVIKLFHLPSRVGNFSDHASWVKSIIVYFENRKDVELHVAGPHIRLKRSIQEFELRGIKYYFYRSEFSSFARLVKNYRIWKSLQRSGTYIKTILKKVEPELVILSGAENPVTSVSILYAKQYPRLCLCQTVYNDPILHMNSLPDKLKVEVEQAILSELNYFGVYCKRHFDLLRNHISDDKYIFKFNYPSRGKRKAPASIDKKFDFVNFAANHSRGKGTFDSVRALAIVKKQYPSVKLNIVGGCSEKIRKELDELIQELDLTENVFFTPYFEKRSDMILHIQQSRFAVLPSKVDNTSGTMLQAMRLGLPLVVYKTSGTPAFNKNKECALIAEMDDIEGLAKHMLSLLNDPQKAVILKENGMWYKENQTEISIRNWERMVGCFQSIIDNFKYGTPIPLVGLFNPEEDE